LAGKKFERIVKLINIETVNDLSALTAPPAVYAKNIREDVDS
jgi:hypothetical protein